MLIILSFSSVLYFYLGMEDKKESIDQKILLGETKLDLHFTKRIFELQNTYNSKLESFLNDPAIVDAFEKKDRKLLASLVQP